MCIPTRTRLALTAAIALLAVGRAAHAQTTQSATGSVTILEPALTVTKTSDLSFGAVIRPTSGSGTISVDANSGNVTPSNVSIASSGTPAARAAFTVEGVPSRNIQVTVPSNFTMTHAGGSETLNATLQSSMGGGQIGSNGSVSFYVGGQLTLSSSVVAGSYTGNFAVTVTYN